MVCFTGDGALYYHLVELETAARYGINVVVVVNDNSARNQKLPPVRRRVRRRQRGRGREMWGFTDVDVARVAESLGCLGIRVERPKDLHGALETALAANRPVVVDAITDVHALADRAWTP